MPEQFLCISQPSKGMTRINLDNWQFELGGSSSFKGTPLYREPEKFRATHLELLLRLAADDKDDTAFQRQIQSRLSSEPVAQSWRRRRTFLRSLPHFSQYRKTTKYDHYHEAARAVAAGNATDSQVEMVAGLNQEIASSKVLVPAGQVLFHGRGDETLHNSLNYPAFISTSLDPVVSAIHARKRKRQGGAAGRAFVYALTLKDDLPAIWGNSGKTVEWELLFGTNLCCSLGTIHSGEQFDVVEATLGR